MSHTLVKRICDLLRDKDVGVNDPNRDRAAIGHEWIHWDYPRLTDREWPRIGVLWTTTSTEPIHIGATVYEDDIFVDIFILSHRALKKGNDFTNENAMEISEDVSDAVELVLRSNLTTIKTWGNYHKAVIVGKRPVYDGDLVGQVVTFRVLFHHAG